MADTDAGEDREDAGYERHGRRRRKRVARREDGRQRERGARRERRGGRRSKGVSPSDIVSMYRFLLQRDPSEEETRDRLADGDMATARANVVATPEFADNAGRWLAEAASTLYALARKLYGENLNQHEWQLGHVVTSDIEHHPDVRPGGRRKRERVARREGGRQRDRGARRERRGGRRSKGLSPSDIVSMYRFLLRRDPSGEETRDRLADGDIASARANVVATPEFAAKADRWLSEQPLVVFYHVPKAGGRSFRAVAGELYGQNYYWHSGRRGHVVTTDIERRPETLRYVPFAGGHIYTPGLFDRLQRPVVHLATMRNSVDRAISSYNFIRSREPHPLHDRLRRLSFFEALSQIERFRKKAMGEQLRVIFGTQGAASSDERRRILRTEKYIISKLEHFDAFVAYVGEHVVERPGLTAPHENVGSAGYREDVRKQPDFPEAIKLLQEENKEEMEFYNSFGDLFVSEPMQRFLERQRLGSECSSHN